jgi:hypothetical protein
MKLKLHSKWLIALLFIPTFESSYAQTDTYAIVYNLLKANCTAGCHSGGSPAGKLDLSGNSAAVYANLVGVNPINPTALAKGDKRVSPGDPHRSFLLRKCNNGLDSDNGIVAAEGVAMPQNAPGLTNVEIETIRQWIIFGAKQSGSQIDTAIIHKYYSGKGINATIAPLAPPPVGQGFQVHFGPLLMDVSHEAEFFLKHDLKLPDTLEVNRIDLKMPKQSHHFIIDKFKPGQAANYANGLRDVTNSALGTGSDLVSAWALTADNDLPVGTAYQWEKSSILDLNFHFFNTNKDSILMVDVRFNVYTQAKGTAKDIMYSELIPYYYIVIPNDNKDHVFTDDANDPNAKRMWNVWLLSSHTHKYGVDYDIYKRKPGGGKADQLYEGYYNFDYTFNQGYYDWAHPAVRHFDPLIPINPKDGFIHETTYRNNGSKAVQWGNTTDDEMMLIYVQYTLGPLITGVEEEQAISPINLNAFPNPYSEYTQLVYRLEKKSDVKVEIFNLLGEKIKTFANEVQSPGNYNYIFSARKLGYQTGIYIARISVNGKMFTQKLVEID